MNIITKTIKKTAHLLEKHPKTKQWLWFVILWLFGFLAVTALTYPIKILIRFLK